MNKKQKIILYIVGSIVLSSILVWIAYGKEIFTKTQVLIEKKDDLFPDMVQKQWIDKFVWGLDLSGAISGIAIITGLIFIFIFRTKKQHSSE